MNNLHLENYIKAQIMYSEYQNSLKQLSFYYSKIQECQLIFENKMEEFLYLLKKHFDVLMPKEEFMNIFLQFNFDSTIIMKYFLENYNLNKNTEINNFHKINDNGNGEVHDEVYQENILLKEKYLKALNEKDHKRHFQVYYIFKHKIKRMYRVDCMTRKINVNFYHYVKDNVKQLNVNKELLEMIKSNVRFTSREKFREIYAKYPSFTKIFNNYLNSNYFKSLLASIKSKYDLEYQKLFIRHSMNFLNFFLKEYDSVPDKKVKHLKKENSNHIEC